eukprot:CAMPEP_0175898354 /NCGR_PEP_ID=MMETSP0108-20121206/1213_1 /TAXON_ID=195067 ORGANISM="Goniomonas pacifica, Strain CCMP1869" /NCGR_SAMPLE_ID=MMETSP0108 /ASSEMBLY_ACC=CAM_ASM_000204 /LENGTH=214 /DNA_ID=CAMNT_0017219723 /DNA_START=31 /DNA_END=678 /DNA_ORIENTATION=-
MTQMMLKVTSQRSLHLLKPNGAASPGHVAVFVGCLALCLWKQGNGRGTVQAFTSSGNFEIQQYPQAVEVAVGQNQYTPVPPSPADCIPTSASSVKEITLLPVQSMKQWWFQEAVAYFTLGSAWGSLCTLQFGTNGTEVTTALASGLQPSAEIPPELCSCVDEERKHLLPCHICSPCSRVGHLSSTADHKDPPSEAITDVAVAFKFLLKSAAWIL